MSCPVDHSAHSNPPSNAGGCPVDHKSLPQQSSSSSSADKCPVDHQSSSSPWSRFLSSRSEDDTHPSRHSHVLTNLSTDREASSIPRLEGDKWVYPSESQFFAAMARKNHNPQAKDMRVIVPIHNAVNERTWYEVLKWEEGRGSEACGGLKLVSFKGKSQELSPRARFKSLLGYAPPFDRHDWVVDRCGHRVRYIIDFYTGKSLGPNSTPSFYLDVRPALDSWEGVKLRFERFCGRWFGIIPQLSSSSPGPHPPSQPPVGS
ncbi:cytochrome c and c1 heme-lyase [Thelephora ganbajun]|uniref:Cytochrome c and c1 heme-lyase n=1 Tax=Thelephora ganbajun TaxID=370292 RepID=A0ACB6ZTS8_THEGA|nr:cytochrome c and c1 heme-lyase [Thelephora ganbajun]